MIHHTCGTGYMETATCLFDPRVANHQNADPCAVENDDARGTVLALDGQNHGNPSGKRSSGILDSQLGAVNGEGTRGEGTRGKGTSLANGRRTAAGERALCKFLHILWPAGPAAGGHHQDGSCQWKTYDRRAVLSVRY